MHTLGTGDDRLAIMDHAILLRVLRNVVQNTSAVSLFAYWKEQGLLTASLDRVAEQFVTQARKSRIGDPVTVGDDTAQVVTLNMTSEGEQDTRRLVTGLYTTIVDALTVTATSVNVTPAELAGSLVHSIRDKNQPDVTGDSQALRRHLRGDRQVLHYNFAETKTLYRQRLSLEKANADPQAATAFRWHKVLVTIDHADFEGQIRVALDRWIDARDDLDDDDKDDMRDALARVMDSPLSHLNDLKRLVNVEGMGQIKKETQIRYLEFLGGCFETGHACGALLRALAERLRAIDRYIRDPNRPDTDYRCSLGGQTLNLRDLLAPAHVFNALPVIPEIDGNIGEGVDPERYESQYTFGIRMKLNGTVQQAPGRPTSYRYHLGKLDSAAGTSPARRLTLLFVYLVALDNLGHDDGQTVIARFVADVLPVLQGHDEQAKASMIAEKVAYLRNNGQIGATLTTLTKGITDKLRGGHLTPHSEYRVAICVLKGVLDASGLAKGVDSFFRDDLFVQDGHGALSYLSVSETAVEQDAIYKLSARIAIDTMRAYAVPDARDDMEMSYAFSQKRQLPIVLAPRGQKLYDTYLLGSTGLALLGRPTRPPQAASTSSGDAFLYAYAYSLLAWLVTHAVTAAVGDDVFIPVLRFHTTHEADAEEGDALSAALGKVMAHLLGQRHLTSSQGLSLASTLTGYQIQNARSSLYATLPKRFAGRLDAIRGAVDLDRCAILAVSSRACDSLAGDEGNRVLTIAGESIGLVRLDTGDVAVQRLRRFTGTYPARDVPTKPTAILDEVVWLYGRGYRHILYIAASPYKTTLHLADAQVDDELFFMSGSILGQMREGKAGLTVYPVFFDTYPVVEFTGGKAPSRNGRSLYVQDTRELMTLMRDPAKQIAVFLNLFTGKTVRSKGDTLYNGVMSYATARNMHPEIVDNAAIDRGLIYDDPTKDALMLYLTLLHFARYEADGDEIVLKLNPYGDIIGDDSVGKHALLPHFARKRSFNLLAFLGYVEQILARKEG